LEYNQIIMKLGGHLLIGYIPVTCNHYAYCNLYWQLSRVIKVDKYADDSMIKISKHLPNSKKSL